MKVWVLFVETNDPQLEQICGVYSSRKLAKKSIAMQLNGGEPKWEDSAAHSRFSRLDSGINLTYFDALVYGITLHRYVIDAGMYD